MKRLLFLLFVMFAGVANATNYYLSATGNDASAGTSPATAWKTTTKVNSFSFAANDSILFKRGDVFYGAVVVKRNNLIISAYGTGARPVISGFTTDENNNIIKTNDIQNCLGVAALLVYHNLVGAVIFCGTNKFIDKCKKK